MATAEAPLTGLPQAEASQALARSWRRLTRAATAVAVITSPAVFVWFTQSSGMSWTKALLLTVLVVVVFRGFADLLFRRLIPSPSMFGIETRELREEDVVGRRRAWFWRFWFKIVVFFFVVITVVWLFRGGSYFGTVGFILDGIGNILSSPALWIQVVFVFFLFIANFGILFGPLLAMNLTQIKTFEPGDAQWGVKLDDVRGQAEAKEEVRRVVSIWQSGEQFERHGGKRERGVLFFGPPGTGKTMLAKALATGFNSPFVSIPGSGFAATFIGIDAIVVRYLAWKAKRAARKWGGTCIVFIDEIDAVGMRRQALGGGTGGFGGAINVPPLTPMSFHDELFYGPWGSLNPSGDLILETRAWRDKLFASRETPTVGPSGFAASLMRFYGFMFPGGMGGMGGMALNQLLVVMDGIDNPPFMRRVITNRTNTLLDASFIVPAARQGQVAPAPRAAPAQRAGLLHRRHERADRPARPGADPPGPHGPARLVPDADQARPARHHRPVHQQGARTTPSSTCRPAPRRDRACDERLLAGDDRAGHVDGADDRAPLRPRAVQLGGPRRVDHDARVRHGDRHRVHRSRGSSDRAPRGRARDRGPRLHEGLRVDAAVDPAPRRLRRSPPGAREGGALLPLPERDVRAARVGARRDGRRARVLQRELDGCRRRRHVRHGADRRDGRRGRDGAAALRRHSEEGRDRGGGP